MSELNKPVTRRGVLAAGAMASLALACPVTQSFADEAAWDAEADVVVVGAGGAGDMATLRLAEAHGMSVILLEALGTPIGGSHLCGGGLDFCETDKCPGPREDLYNDLVNAAQGDLQEDVARSYVDNAAKTYEALIGWGVEFMEDPLLVPYQSQPWMHMVNGGVGANVMSPMEERIAANENVTLLTDTRARRLVVDDSGRVIGVEAETADGSSRFGAKHGIVLACGGFANNPELMKALGPQGIDTIVPTVGQGTRGDGLLMALAVGADVSYLGAGTRPGVTKGTTTGTLSTPYMGYGAILVGLDGRRFANEADNYVLITSAAINKLKDFQMFAISDSVSMSHGEDTQSHFAGAREPEFCGETFEELGENIRTQYPDFDYEALAAEVERYNSFVDAGVDEDFGSFGFVGASGTPVKFTEPPFYAMPLSPAIEDVRGGLKINGESRVMNAITKEPIPGLFAAGEVTGGLHGYGYMSGTAFGKALIHAYVAAETIAADAGVE